MFNTMLYEDGMDFQGDLTQERLLYPLLEYNESSYIPEPYVPPRIINETHLHTRFGRLNTLNGVIDGNKEQTREYVTGVVIGSLIIAIVAVIWFFVVVCLKVAGPKRVGFLSGRFVRPYDSPQKEEDDDGVEVILEGDQPSDENGDAIERIEPTTLDSTTSPTSDPRVRKNFGIRVGIVRTIFVLSGLAVIASGEMLRILHWR